MLSDAGWRCRGGGSTLEEDGAAETWAAPPGSLDFAWPFLGAFGVAAAQVAWTPAPFEAHWSRSPGVQVGPQGGRFTERRAVLTVACLS